MITRVCMYAETRSIANIHCVRAGAQGYTLEPLPSPTPTERNAIFAHITSVIHVYSLKE